METEVCVKRNRYEVIGIVCFMIGLMSFLVGVFRFMHVQKWMALALGVLGGVLGTVLFMSSFETRSPDRKASTDKLRILRAFRYFCSRSSRDTVDFTIHDLKLDIEEMRALELSDAFVKRVVLWRSLSLIMAMVWSAVVEPVVKVWSALKAK